MSIERTEKLPVRAKPDRKAAQAPLSDRYQKQMTEKQFAELFRLFFTAVSHETGNGLHTVTLLSTKTNDKTLQTLADNVSVDYKKISVLRSLATGAELSRDPSLMHLTLEERERIGLKINGISYSIHMGALKEIALGIVRDFKISLHNLESYADKLHIPDEAPESILVYDLKRSVEMGNMLADCLEQLMLGEFDIKSQLMPMHVASVANKGDLSGCIVDCKFEPESLRHATVIANHIFVTLINSNILSNAKRAMDEIDACPAVSLRVYQGDDTVVFEFRDNGMGMPEELVEKLNSGIAFSTKDEEGQHGLGFSYCREIAGKMGAELYVKESLPGIGTTVVLELRLAD